MLRVPSECTVVETFYDTGGKVITGKIVYPLDAQNQPIGAISYNAKGAVITKSSYQRDAYGRIGEETITSATGQFLRRRLYSYGTKNKVSRVDEYDENGVLLAPPPRAATGAGVPDKKKRK